MGDTTGEVVAWLRQGVGCVDIWLREGVEGVNTWLAGVQPLQVLYCTVQGTVQQSAGGHV